VNPDSSHASRWGVPYRVNVTHRQAVTYGLDAVQRHGLPGCVCVPEFCVMIVLYARVSTNHQTTTPQVTQAEAAGFKIDKVLSDEGVSGVSTRLAEQPQGKRLLDMLRSG
jgi:hypothetical protein